MPFDPGESFREKDGNGGVGIDLIDGCNIRCQQCFYAKGKAPFKRMTLEQVRIIIEKTVKSGRLKEFYILGGEPTLHPDLPAVIDAALPHFKPVILVTNGVKLADRDYCRTIARPGLMLAMHRRAIRESARGLVDVLMQTEGGFDLNRRAWHNVEELWQGPVAVQCNLLKPLLVDGHVFDVFRWARLMGYTPIMELTKPGPIFERGHELDVTAEEVEELYRKMREFDRKYHPEHEAKIGALTPPSYGNVCTMIETGIHVLNDGTVLPCIAHTTLSLGNIFTDDLDEMLGSELRLAIRDYANWIVGPCRACEHFESCHGGCRGEALWDTGCPRASDPYCWHHAKSLTLKDMVPPSCDGCLLEGSRKCEIKVR